MGQSRLGLCPTRNRPDGIGWSKISPDADLGVDRSGRSSLQRVANRLVSVIDLRKQLKNGKETTRKQWEKPKSSENLIRIYEISPNLAKISPDSMRFRQIWSKSYQIYWKYCWNLGFFTEIWKIFTGIWVFSPKSRNFSSKSGFLSNDSSFSSFGGGKPKLTHQSQFLVEKTCHKLPE